jgi:hypothetical protein
MSNKPNGKTLTTFRQVERQLGGIPLIATLTKRSEQNVSNWRTRGYFPAIMWLVISDALGKRGYDAHPALFRLEQVDDADAA